MRVQAWQALQGLPACLPACGAAWHARAIEAVTAVLVAWWLSCGQQGLTSTASMSAGLGSRADPPSETRATRCSASSFASPERHARSHAPVHHPHHRVLRRCACLPPQMQELMMLVYLAMAALVGAMAFADLLGVEGQAMKTLWWVIHKMPTC